LSSGAAVGAVAPTGEAVGRGGIESKLDAAKKACRSGAAVVIALASRPGVVADVLRGEDVGTLVLADAKTLRARKHWIAYTLRPRGTVIVDEGAASVLRAGKSSLLPVGVLGVRGEFHIGDAVRLVGADGAEVGRGLTRFSALDIARSAGKRKPELELLFGLGAGELVVVHKDDLVISDPSS
jgi:glutamate 5-kinase